MAQPSKPCSPDEGGMAFTGTPGALSTLLAFADQTGAVLLWREDERLPSPFLLLRVSCAAEVKPAERLYAAFLEGKFPGVERRALAPTDDHLGRQMLGPDAF